LKLFPSKISTKHLWNFGSTAINFGVIKSIENTFEPINLNGVEIGKGLRCFQPFFSFSRPYGRL
jgi:hypothetical protein